MNQQVLLTPFDEVIKRFSNGEIVIIIDDADRENEGDLCCATDFVTAEKLQFMSNHGRGLICVSIDHETAKRLNFPFQVQNNASQFYTPFTVSVDHKSVTGSGMLPVSKAFTIKELINPNAKAEDFISPGATFPLIANPRGVLGRNGQTEGSYDLARLSGLSPSGIICEILADDGTMLRGDGINQYAKKHNLAVTSVEEIQKARLKDETLFRQVAVSKVNTDFGEWTAHVFQDDVQKKEHIALVYGNLKNLNSAPLVRLHSECLTGDVFGSLRCDCGNQLKAAQEMIIKEGAGVILYLRQEGRGIGLTNKLKAYALQDKGFDTVEANLELGFAADERDFNVGAKILNLLEIKKIRLVTNNPEKLDVLADSGIEILERVSVVVPKNKYSENYIEAKRTKLGHLI